VLLVDLPGMQSDIVRALLKNGPHSEVIVEVSERADLLRAVRERQPDVVIIGLKDTDLGPDWDRLFVEQPHLRVLAVTPDCRRIGEFSEPVPRDLLARRPGKEY
jgi:chemotaxis response regulator CheB